MNVQQAHIIKIVISEIFRILIHFVVIFEIYMVCLLDANHASIFYSQKVPIFIYNIFSFHVKTRKTLEVMACARFLHENDHL